MRSIQLLSLAALAVATPLERRDGWGDWSDGQYSVPTSSTPTGGVKTSSTPYGGVKTSSTTTTTTTAATWGIPANGSPSSPVQPASTPAGGKPSSPAAPASTPATWGIPANGSPSSPVAPASTPAGGKPTGPAGGQPSGPAGPGCGAPSTVTVTVTATPTWGDWSSGSASASASGSATTCVVSDAKATSIVNNFIDLLQYTSYNGSQGAPGRGYHYNTSAATLDPAFVDISDSINFMAGFPLGAVTFPNKTAFDYGQGVLQPEVSVTTLNIWHDCSSITWRWSVVPKIPNALPVHGINYMQINSKGLIQKNYAEFDNGAWIYDYGKTACYLSQGQPTALPQPALKL